MDKKALLKHFGKNLKIARIKKNLTQKQLAQIMGKSQNYVACVECGLQNISLGKALEFANLIFEY